MVYSKRHHDDARFTGCLVGLAVLLVLVGMIGIGGAIGPEWLRVAPYVVAPVVALVVVLVIVLVIGVLEIRARQRGWRAELKSRLGLGRGKRHLARRLGMSVAELEHFRPDYRRKTLAKRGGGVRELQVPDASTKALQRAILRRVLAPLRSHHCATAYERGKSIVDNARPHVGQAVVLRLDLVDFFPTTRAARIERYFRRVGWNRGAAELLTRLVSWDGGLPQGAPTSPRLANLVNWPIDASIAGYCRRLDLAYTRYADDLTISFPTDRGRHVRAVVQYVSRLVENHGYRIHRGPKLNVRRRHQRQVVTGLVVNDKLQLPRQTRRKLRAVAHRLDQGRATDLTPAQLQGWLGLLHMTSDVNREPAT